MLKKEYRNGPVFRYLIPFVFAFTIYWITYYSLTDMITYSSDAADIWKTIESFHSGNIYGSYVLYKGINSIYPYVWLYDFAKLIGANEWFFIKIFYGLAFSYISAIGFPNIVEYLTGGSAYCFKRIINICILFFLWTYTKIFSCLMIDLPCLFYFVFLVHIALRMYRKKANLISYVFCGLLCGICMSASGQYAMPSICLLIFIIWISLKAVLHKSKKDIRHFFERIIFLFLCMILIIGLNYYFENEIVNPLRNNGAWIPTGNDWLSVGLSRFMNTYRQGSYSLTIPSTRNLAIFQDYLGGEFNALEPVIYGGGYPLTIIDYLKIFIRYPFDFILCYLNSFFLILSPDGGAFNFWPLFLFYSLLYAALYIGVKKCKKIGNFFSALFWIGFSFVWAIVPLLVMNIEARTCIQIQGLIVALAVCDDTFWNGLKRAFNNLVSGSRHIIFTRTVAYTLIGWFLFISFCFLHIATLYEGINGSADNVLINFSMNFLKG